MVGLSCPVNLRNFHRLPPGITICNQLSYYCACFPNFPKCPWSLISNDDTCDVISNDDTVMMTLPCDSGNVKVEVALTAGVNQTFKLNYFRIIFNRLIGKYPMLGRTGGRRKRGWQRIRWLEGIIDSMDMGLGRLRELLMDSEAWCAAMQRVGHDWATELNWTDLMITNSII